MSDSQKWSEYKHYTSVVYLKEGLPRKKSFLLLSRLTAVCKYIGLYMRTYVMYISSIGICIHIDMYAMYV